MLHVFVAILALFYNSCSISSHLRILQAKESGMLEYCSNISAEDYEETTQEVNTITL